MVETLRLPNEHQNVEADFRPHSTIGGNSLPCRMALWVRPTEIRLTEWNQNSWFPDRLRQRFGILLLADWRPLSWQFPRSELASRSKPFLPTITCTTACLGFWPYGTSRNLGRPKGRRILVDAREWKLGTIRLKRITQWPVNAAIGIYPRPLNMKGKAYASIVGIGI